jgi:hypothetical protein
MYSLQCRYISDISTAYRDQNINLNLCCKPKIAQLWNILKAYIILFTAIYFMWKATKIESLSLAVFYNPLPGKKPLNSYLEETLFMATFVSQKTNTQLIADEDWSSTAGCWTENPKNSEGYWGFSTASHNLYVGYLFHDSSRNTCVSRNPVWKIFYDMPQHQVVQVNRYSTLRRDIHISSLSTIKLSEENLSFPFEAEENSTITLQSQTSKPFFSIKQFTAQRGKAMRSCGVI